MTGPLPEHVTGAPVVDGIPYLRRGRDDLRERVSGLLAAGDVCPLVRGGATMH